MWHALRSLLLIIAHANLLMGLCGACTVVAVQRICGLPLSPLPLVINTLTFFAVYSLDRLAGREADDINHAERSAFLRRQAGWLGWAAMIAYVAALGLSLLGGTRAVWATLLPLVVLILYAFPWVPPVLARRLGFRRLKEVFVVKNMVVAATWASISLALAMVFGSTVSYGGAALAWLFIFGRMWINSVVFDLRDVEGDRQQGVKTVPVVVGPARTLRLLHVLNAALALLCLAVGFGVGLDVVAVLSLSSLYTALYLGAAGRKCCRDMHFLCDVIVDGEWLFIGALAVICR